MLECRMARHNRLTDSPPVRHNDITESFFNEIISYSVKPELTGTRGPSVLWLNIRFGTV